jgi:dynein heavy chain 2
VEARMEKLSVGLREVDDKVAMLKKQFEAKTTEATRLKVNLDKEKETIIAAENLVSKLEGEYQRWSNQVHAVNDHE